MAPDRLKFWGRPIDSRSGSEIASPLQMAVRPARVVHVIENKAEAAYRRGDLFEKRRKIDERIGSLLRKLESR
jgi:hypothetical protein